ncbi:Pyruvate decarboxylase 1 [Monosporozyma unispora]|nr:Pyruvate decarboxylase 1 [Kazachstania unispora]
MSRTFEPRYGAVYVGTLCKPSVKKAAGSADLTLSVMALLSDFNSGSFSYKIKNIVAFHSDYTKFKSGSDIVLTETGTSDFGINSSIGFTGGGGGGAVVALSFADKELDPKRRVILFIGDGSFLGEPLYYIDEC